LSAALTAHGVEVLAHGRDPDRLRSAAEETGAVRTYLADLASLADVRRLAAEVREAEPRLDLLVSNAGIGSDVPGGEQRLESADGQELRFAVNYLAGWLLTQELLPLLRDSAPARIVNVSSAGQMGLDLDDLQLEHGYSGWRAYCQSKLAQILSTFTLAEELDGSGVTVTALHPATFMPTKIVPSPTSTLEEGVEATLRLAIDPELDGVTGRYFNGQSDSRADAQAYDPDARARLETASRELVDAALR
jgi:NAD(P)-dependent dehydrogenase (short-subunit alcohol dehydrogenase family)